jgi:hypothetical protein
MNDKITLISTIVIGTIAIASSLICVGKIYNDLSKKDYETKKGNGLEDKINSLKSEIGIYDNMIAKLRKESFDITGYITENAMNYNDMKKFDTQTWSNKLSIVNEAWKQAEVKRKILSTKLEVLTK